MFTTNSKSVIWSLVAAALIALTLYISSINEGIIRDVSLMVCAAVIGIAITSIANIAWKIEVRKFLLLLLITIPTITAIVFITLYYRSGRNPIAPSPIATNVIANFNGPKGAGALTNYGLPFSMMSDSGLNMSSKVWYERIQNDLQSGGFMRVHYQMLPSSGHEGFVGVYADFTLPPATPVSFNRYNGIGFRMRIGQESGVLPEVRVVLYSDNIKNMEYAYPIARVQLDDKWRYYDIPFNKFESPPHAISNIKLDPGRVFRFAFVFVSDNEIHGHIDIDEVKLFE